MDFDLYIPSVPFLGLDCTVHRASSGTKQFVASNNHVES